jgi:hypothetical protein
VHAARGQADHDVPGRHRGAVDDRVALDDAERESRQVEIVGAVHVRQLGGLAPEQRAPRLAAARRHALDDVRHAPGLESPDRDVVEEQDRIGAAREHVVDAHADEIDAGVMQAARFALQQELRAHAVRAGDEHGVAIAARGDEAGEATEITEHARRARRPDGTAHALDDGVRRLQRDPRLRVRKRLGSAARAHARAGSRSKRNLPAASSGTGTG